MPGTNFYPRYNHTNRTPALRYAPTAQFRFGTSQRDENGHIIPGETALSDGNERLRQDDLERRADFNNFFYGPQAEAQRQNADARYAQMQGDVDRRNQALADLRTANGAAPTPSATPVTTPQPAARPQFTASNINAPLTPAEQAEMKAGGASINYGTGPFASSGRIVDETRDRTPGAQFARTTAPIAAPDSNSQFMKQPNLAYNTPVPGTDALTGSLLSGTSTTPVPAAKPAIQQPTATGEDPNSVASGHVPGVYRTAPATSFARDAGNSIGRTIASELGADSATPGGQLAGAAAGYLGSKVAQAGANALGSAANAVGRFFTFNNDKSVNAVGQPRQGNSFARNARPVPTSQFKDDDEDDNKLANK